MHFTQKEKIKLIFICILIVITLIFFSDIVSFYQNLESLLRESTIAPLIYIILMILAILIAPIPASPLAITAGAIFGPWQGMIYTLISATLGACIAFLIARFILYDLLHHHLARIYWYQKLQSTPPKRLALVVGLTRLMPQVSFDLISYAAGITSISLPAFALATFIGMIPIVFLFSFFGAALQPHQSILLTVLLLIFIISVIFSLFRKKKL